MRDARIDELQPEEALRFPQAFIRQDDGFRLVDRVADQTARVQAIQHIPIETFPSAIAVVQGQMQEREHGVVDCLKIDIHFHTFLSLAVKSRVKLLEQLDEIALRAVILANLVEFRVEYRELSMCDP